MDALSSGLPRYRDLPIDPSKPPHSAWGVFGDDDEVGTINLLTPERVRRAAGLVNGRRLALVKVARRREHLLFDVPVVGLGTVPVMNETGTTVLALEAGRTLMLDKAEMIRRAGNAVAESFPGVIGDERSRFRGAPIHSQEVRHCCEFKSGTALATLF